MQIPAPFASPCSRTCFEIDLFGDGDTRPWDGRSAVALVEHMHAALGTRFLDGHRQKSPPVEHCVCRASSLKRTSLDVIVDTSS